MSWFCPVLVSRTRELIQLLLADVQLHLWQITFQVNPEEVGMDSEKQHLNEMYLDSEDSEDSLWMSELCQEKHNMLRTELEARRVARRKLLMACMVIFIFMTGEVMGKTKDTFPDLSYTIQCTSKICHKV